jgi:hypothetical protein
LFRFAEERAINGAPAIANFEYKKILSGLVIAWILVLVLSGVYRFNHATLVVFNLRQIIKRSFAFFFFLGFLSFILKASFSRSVFLVMLTSGLAYLFIVRITMYFVVLRPLILGKKVTSKMMIVGREKKDLEAHSDWLIKNRSLGFSIVARLACPEITITWIEEFDRLLRHLGQHRIGAAERHNRELGEEDADLPEDMLITQRGQNQGHRRRPYKKPRRDRP